MQGTDFRCLVSLKNEGGTRKRTTVDGCDRGIEIFQSNSNSNAAAHGHNNAAMQALPVQPPKVRATANQMDEILHDDTGFWDYHGTVIKFN